MCVHPAKSLNTISETEVRQHEIKASALSLCAVPLPINCSLKDALCLLHYKTSVCLSYTVILRHGG